jgi:hypothetical protein
MMTLMKEMTARIPNRNEHKQRLESFEAHEEGASQDSEASLFEVYLEEQANLRFTNQRLQTEKEKYEQQLQEEKEKINETVDNGKKKGVSGSTKGSSPRTMPLPSIRLTFGSVGCVLYVLGSIGKGTIVDRLDLKFLLHLNARTVGNPATRTKMPLPLTRRSITLAIGSVGCVHRMYRKEHHCQ